MKRTWGNALAKWIAGSIVVGLIIFFVSILFYPEWKASLRGYVTLAGVIITAFLIPLFQLMVPFVIEQRREHERKRRSEWAFERETGHSIRLLKPPLRGIPETIYREEVEEIVEQLKLGRPVLLTGDAGSGKSGIAVALVSKLADQNIRPILIDARRLASVRNSADLTEHFELSEPLVAAIERQGRETGVRVVLDQVDSMVGTEGTDATIDLLIDCSTLDGVEVVAVSRRKVAREERALRPLTDAGFQEIVCRPLTPELVSGVLAKMGVASPPPELVDVGANLLNLEIICEIINETGADQLDDFQHEIGLWERYRRVILEREDRNPGLRGEDILAEAIRLATLGLSSPDRSFQIPFPPNPYQARLISSTVIIQDSGRSYRFQHERLQDYLYAWHASENGLMPHDVYDEIGDDHARNVLNWMMDRYRGLGAPQYGPFLEELLSG